MKTILSVLFLVISPVIFGQVVEFSANDDTKKVFKGDVVKINADTAYVVSISRAKYLNQKLTELAEIKTLYNDLAANRNRLLDELNKVQKLVSNLLTKLNKDSTLLTNELEIIITDLDNTLVELKNNNAALKSNNAELLTKINQLERIVKDLKRENRWVWWNGLADKAVVLAGGIAIGFLLGKL